jgi:hypothetical protein
VVEFRMEGRDVEGIAADLVPVESFQMTQVENEPMPLWDGPRIESAGS